MTNEEISVLDALVKGEHINIYEDSYVLSRSGKTVGLNAIRYLERLDCIVQVRPGNYDLAEKGKAVWQYETNLKQAGRGGAGTMSQTPFSDVKPVSYEEFIAGDTKGDKLMSKPSQELLRRAREFCKGKPVDDDVVTPTKVVISPFMAEFAEQIVRECAEIASREVRFGVSNPDRISDVILRKFGLKE